MRCVRVFRAPGGGEPDVSRTVRAAASRTGVGGNCSKHRERPEPAPRDGGSRGDFSAGCSLEAEGLEFDRPYALLDRRREGSAERAAHYDRLQQGKVAVAHNGNLTN